VDAVFETEAPDFRRDRDALRHVAFPLPEEIASGLVVIAVRALTAAITTCAGQLAGYANYRYWPSTLLFETARMPSDSADTSELELNMRCGHRVGWRDRSTTPRFLDSRQWSLQAYSRLGFWVAFAVPFSGDHEFYCYCNVGRSVRAGNDAGPDTVPFMHG
jgi:hypothetical protein